MSGLIFGRYETLFRIAAGGMAEVFAARSRGEAGFAKLVAVKRVLPALGDDESFTRMFLEEARVAAQLASPHIVQTIDMGRSDGLPFMVQELVVGVDLVEIIVTAARRGRDVPIDVALEILAQAAIGLHDAHEARTPDDRALELVHRDVSPHNLLVGADGRVRLTDFGVARVAFDRLVATHAGTLKGKLAYLSPEQLAGRPLDRRSDVFGLGIVAWEMLSGHRLFARGSPTDTMQAVRAAPIPSVAEARPDVPARAASVIARALERDVARRLGSAREMADELRRAGRDADLELSDARIADYVRDLAPPRLEQLKERLRSFAAQPHVETLPDIDLPDETEMVEQPTEIDSSVPTRQVKKPGPAHNVVVADAETVIKEPPPETALDLRRFTWEHGHWLIPALIAIVGILLAIIAVLVVVLRA